MMALSLKHQTPAQFAARFWARVQQERARKDQTAYHRRVWQLWNWVQAGDITTAEARQSFNAAYGRSLTLAQWNSFVTSRVVPIKDRYVALQAEADL